MLGQVIDARSFKGRSVNARSMLSLAVLHRCVADCPDTLPQVIERALALSVATGPTTQLMFSMSLSSLPMLIKAWIGSEQPSFSNEMTKRAYHEAFVTHRTERDAKDPAKNGNPEGALELPKPHLRDSFSWWCLKLGFMLDSPHVDEPRYVAVIDEIGDQCIRLLPEAQAQAIATNDKPPGAYDRYGTVENDSLPKYARWLLKRGLYERAKLVCESSLQHGIQPKSPGAFDRSLVAANKRLVRSR